MFSTKTAKMTMTEMVSNIIILNTMMFMCILNIHSFTIGYSALFKVKYMIGVCIILIALFNTKPVYKNNFKVETVNMSDFHIEEIENAV